MGFSRAVKIYQSIDYDYERSFGKADSSHAMRSFVFDQAVLDFWKDHPEGTVVNLGEGLETQRFRLTDNRPKDTVWLSVDLPEAIEAREKFITADQSNIHVPVSALDVESWAKKVPADKAVFITAQGILMYLEPDNVKSLFQDIAKTFPGATLMFDMISKFFSDMAMKGWKKTEHYTVPQLPFGVNKFDAQPLLHGWVDGLDVEEVPGPTHLLPTVWRYLVLVLMHIPIIRGYQPGYLLRVQFPAVPRN